MEVGIEFHVAVEKARRPKSVDKNGTWRSFFGLKNGETWWLVYLEEIMKTGWLSILSYNPIL